MNQELIDLIGRIENAGPEYIAFRKEVLGTLWNDFDRAELLGPFALHRIDGDEVEYARHLFGEADEGDILLFDPTIGKGICIKPPTKAWHNTFDDFMDEYIERINQLPPQIIELYKDAIKEIKGYLMSRYEGITPKKSRFVEWFVSKLPTPIFYITLIKDAEIKGRLHYKLALRQAPKVLLTPELVERSLHEYCQWRKSQQDEIHAEVLNLASVHVPTTTVIEIDKTTEDEKLDVIIKEFRAKRAEDNPINNVPMNMVVDYFMQLTANKSQDGEPFLTKEQFVNFLRRAFDGQDSVAKIKANYSENINKLAVVKLFYMFYEGAKGKYCAARNTSDRHLRLLTDNFDGFVFESHKKSFNNSKTAKIKWKKLADYC